jgi:hypothetical protein
MSEFTLHRLGMLMEPEPGNPMEFEGVLNPAAVRGPMENSISFLDRRIHRRPLQETQALHLDSQGRGHPRKSDSRSNRS